MNSAAALIARWRVRLGYPLAIVVLWFARPTPRSILWGLPLGLIGLYIRARAAGHLHKQEVLTVTGPYAYTRNPLYLGSAFLTLAASVATHSWISAAILCAYFALFYSVVMRREETELRHHHGEAFEAYARAVPLFFPQLTPAKLSSGGARSFSFAQYKKNHEYQAAIGFLLLLVLLFLMWRFVPGIEDYLRTYRDTPRSS
ncbi:MAG TPA: isoprenylcysteine carboxylmethyltransferase family protein [Candidatus Acidoferrum sp.]|jgi:protein-S-isoprenylcysteine O-methyltransferase Ste14|nr:isoprenylcysteine carboxylmethyltransferase family protein [Candidatus Acidoferrum sp.]